MTLLTLKRQQQKLAAFKAGNEPEPAEAYNASTAFTSETNVLKAARLMQVRVNDDLKRLKAIKSHEGKAELKRQLISDYQPFVDSYMNSGYTVENQVITEYMVWLFDIGEVHTALAVGVFVIDQGLPMPERFKGNVETFITDSILVWANAEIEQGHSIEPYFDTVLGNLLDESWDIPNALKAKVYKLHAQQVSEEQPEIAVNFYTQAEALYPKIGVSTAKKKLEKLLESQAAESSE